MKNRNIRQSSKATYYDNGNVNTIEYLNKNGKRNGEYKQYYENKKIKIKANYKNDVLEGLYEEYDENGNKIKICIYKDGKEEIKNEDVDGRS